MKHRPRTLTCLALYCAAGLALTSCSFIGADQLRHTRSPESLSTDPALETTGQAILEDALDALLEANEVKVRAKGSTDGVPFSYVVAGDYDFEYAQSFEMRDGKGHVQWLADGPTSTYFVKANNSHGDLIEPTDHEDFLNALREDRWLRLPESEVASMILVSDEIDELFDFLESSIDHEDMKYQGVLDLDGVPAHRFSSPNRRCGLAPTIPRFHCGSRQFTMSRIPA